MKQILAANTISYFGFSLEEACEQIADIGFTHVEPCMIASYDPRIDDNFFSEKNAENYRNCFEANNLSCIAIAAHMDLGQIASLESFTRRLEFAHAVGARFVHTNTSSIENSDRFYQTIEKLIAVAEKLQVCILLENPGDAGSTIISSYKTGVEVISRIDSPWVRLNYDPSNQISYSQGKDEPVTDIHTLLPTAAHIHLKEFEMKGEKKEFIAIGKGDTDYSTLLKGAARLEHLIPMSIELPLSFYRNGEYRMTSKPENKRPSINEINKVLRDSLDFITSIYR